MTLLTGTFEPSRLIGSGTPSADDSMIGAASKPLEVKMLIDNQDRLVQVDFVGPIFSFEEGVGLLVRRITFSNFDADISIEPPAQTA
jgi:hypothetical protein